MAFYTVCDLGTSSKKILDSLDADGEAVITDNGKPIAIICGIPDGRFEETLKAIRQAKAVVAFHSMREEAANSGYISDQEIEAEIAAVRKEKLHHTN